MSDIAEMMARRTRLLGPNVSTFYDNPLHLVRGDGVWVWDAQGRKYLDCYNNVPHVGHCHPRVVEAICAQACTYVGWNIPRMKEEGGTARNSRFITAALKAIQTAQP